MKKLNLQRTSALMVVLILSLLLGAAPALAQTSPPSLISPADGATVILPTFQWEEVAGAEKYEIQVASDSTFTNQLWLQETEDGTITPINTLPNKVLWWRVRSLDAGGAGEWSAAWSFRKIIPAPNLTIPMDGGTFTTPTFEWNASEGATYYQIQVATNDTFNPVLWQQTTYDLSITPVNPLPNGLLYWRVRGADADGRKGNFSPKRSVTKYIPAPNLVSPLEGASSVMTPTLKWEKAIDATYYYIEVADNDTFTPLLWKANTYNLSITPINTLPNGVLYWRVFSKDGGGNRGDSSAVWSFTKQIPETMLTSPADGATNVQLPTFDWSAVEGASYYHIQVATDNAFTDIIWEEDTYSLSITPISLLPTGALYWRVYAADTDGHVGPYSATRSLTVEAPPTCTNNSLNLIAPANDSTLASDPNLQWSCRQDATHYRVLIYGPDGSLYSSVYTDYTTYTPYDSTSSSTDKPTLRNKFHKWMIEAYQGNTLIDTSSKWDVTKNAPLTLLEPQQIYYYEDPLFSWGTFQGASRYKLLIYEFNSLASSLYTDYTVYTPFNSTKYKTDLATLRPADYKWKVEAYQDSTLLGTSAYGVFYKAINLNLIDPPDGSTQQVDPTLKWGALPGAKRYQVVIATGGRWVAIADDTKYLTYTPYNDPILSRDNETLPDGDYIWYVEAFSEANRLLTTGGVHRSFTKTTVWTLISPEDDSPLTDDPSLEWAKMIGANHYKVLIYLDGVLYSSTNTDYTVYTPYNDPITTTDEGSLVNGSYTWKIEAYKFNNTLLSTSPTWAFTINDNP